MFRTRYRRSLVWPAWSIDLRHVLLIHGLLASGMFRSALEIGAHYGASTCAFVEAAEVSAGLQVWVCDVRIRSAVADMVSESSAAERIHLVQCQSAEMLAELMEDGKAIDVALLDGSHVFSDNALEAALLRCLGTHSLLIHDVATLSCDQYGRDYLFDGPKKLLTKYRASQNWFALLDKEVRVGERTDRGLALVTRDRDIWSAAREVFSHWATASLPSIGD